MSKTKKLFSVFKKADRYKQKIILPKKHEEEETTKAIKQMKSELKLEYWAKLNAKEINRQRKISAMF